MYRLQVVIRAIALALLGVALPLSAIWAISQNLPLRNQRDDLSKATELALARTQKAFSDAKLRLETIASSGTHPCSSPHLALMRQLAINSDWVDELGYFSNGALQCTSWGHVPERVGTPAFDFRTRTGLQGISSMYPAVTGGRPVFALQSGQHNALIAPARLVEGGAAVGIDTTVLIAKDKVLAGSLGRTAALLPEIPDGSTDGEVGGRLYHVQHAGELTAVATREIGTLTQRRQRLFLSLLPLSALVSLSVAIAALKLMHRQLGPAATLAHAIASHEVHLVYQPLVRLDNGKCIGVEVLVRWQRPKGEHIPPSEFVPMAERTGQIQALTRYVIKTGLKELSSILRSDPSLHISFNVSGQDIENTSFIEWLGNQAADEGVGPAQIWLEVTERTMVDAKQAHSALARAQALGMSIAIDDFGTGYSSLQYLQELPVDVLKIDKSFVDTIESPAQNQAIIDHIIGLAKSLGLHVVAEGIESQAQRDYLVEREVMYGQGWLFSRGISATELHVYLSNE